MRDTKGPEPKGETVPNIPKQRIFFVDDEPKIRGLVGRILEQARFKVNCFARASACLEKLRTERCDLLVADVKMPGMDGLELLSEAKRIAPWLPILIVTGYGNVPMATKALKAGASDFIEKPLKRERFLALVESLLEQNAVPNPLLGKGLTAAEMRVLHFILEGKSNKETARLLHRSIGTIEVHRKHIMRKLGVDNIVDLTKRAITMWLVNPPADE